MERVTRLGGVFLKARDPKVLALWYQEHLGISFGDNLYTDPEENKIEYGNRLMASYKLVQ